LPCGRESRADACARFCSADRCVSCLSPGRPAERAGFLRTGLSSVNHWLVCGYQIQAVPNTGNSLPPCGI
jgi:hypothetical protein